ncbi:hypothetical protein ABPG74_017407 [Tetrahymena malaccensis]
MNCFKDKKHFLPLVSDETNQLINTFFYFFQMSNFNQLNSQLINYSRSQQLITVCKYALSQKIKYKCLAGLMDQPLSFYHITKLHSYLIQKKLLNIQLFKTNDRQTDCKIDRNQISQNVINLFYFIYKGFFDLEQSTESFTKNIYFLQLY